MSDVYYLFNIRLGSWVGKTAVGTSQIKDAAEFDLDTAQGRVLRTKTPEGNYSVIPVRKQDLP